jgi:3-dehydroquinate synthetase
MERFLAGPDAEILVGRALPISLPEPSGREKVAVLTQPGRPADLATELASKISEVETRIIELPDRESAKELDVVGDVYDRLADFNLGRHDTIVGVGGGALTDVAGFVAATWLRGVESVLIPTTLLAAVDASIGGKTGINRRGKNLVGAFWHPRRVIVDLDHLGDLPVPLRLEGSAEIIKAGFIADRVIVQEYGRHGIEADLDVVVPRAIGVKAAIVNDDFRESGSRALLNFGHTIGHAVELLAPLPHGLAVSVGMVAAGVVSSRRFGFDVGWLTDLLFATGLPVAAAGVSKSAALELIARDKKRSAEGIRMVLLRSIGDPVVEVVSVEEVEAALDAVGAD